MGYRYRGLVLIGCLFLVSVTAGCSMPGDTNRTTEPVDRGGALRVVPVSDAPENATVIPSSEVQDTDAGILQSELRNASESGERTGRVLSSDEVSTLADQFGGRELYNGSDGPIGYYVRFEGDIYSVLLLEDQ